MSFSDTELLREFVIESQEHLSDIESQLLTLESQGDNMDVALVNTVFRAIHSIKGAAGFMGLDTLGGLAHRAEEVLNRLRADELKPTPLVINSLLRASDRLKELLDRVESSNEEDIEEHVVALERILSGQAGLIEAPSTEPTPSITAGFSLAAGQPTKETLREFLIECHDHLHQLERDLIALESLPSSPVAIDGVFRSIHSIKGSAGFLGFRQLEGISHIVENLLDRVRIGQVRMDTEVGDCVLLAVDAIRDLLVAIESEGDEGAKDYASLLSYLEKLSMSKLAVVPADGGGKQSASHSSKSATRESKSKRKSSAVRQRKSGSKRDPDAVIAAIEPSDLSGDVQASQVAIAAPAAGPGDERVVAAVPAASPLASGGKGTSVGSSGNEVSAAESTIRVDVALLDKLMTCVGELVLARNQILQYTSGQVDTALHRTSQRLNLITTELQEGVMKTRMLPIGNVWAKFPRLVRDLATICEKEVRIEMEGKETELDKTIIEAIKDPLTHLVRNTVDHGIERPEIRAERGKPVEGCLTLRAYHEGGQVNIEICDDGGGLNLDRIKAKAVERGLLSLEQTSRLPDRDVGNLIFLPGFSTAEKVSNVSGRGVGMDVVKTNIEKIGGTVDLQSVCGQGTTIKIKIPLTLAIIPALIVTCDSDRYAIPQVNLLELVRLNGGQPGSEIEWIQGAPVYRLRGRLLPLVYLRAELDLAAPQSAADDAVNIVVLRADDRHFGLVVDRINDTEEIVVKPLSSQLKGVPVYSGTTIMGDGKVALILDVPGLAHAAHVLSVANDRQTMEAEQHKQPVGSDTQTLLVMGLGKSHRVAVPLAQVTRLEKIPLQAVELAEQQEVVQYRNEILPLIRLARTLGITSHQEIDGQPLDVLVYTEQGRSVGIVVDRVIDIVDASLAVTRPSQREGLLVSVVVQGHVTDLLDLPTVIRQTAPNIINQPPVVG